MGQGGVKYDPCQNWYSECSLRWPILEEAISQEPLATMEKQKLSWIPKIPGYPPKSSKITFDDIRLLRVQGCKVQGARCKVQGARVQCAVEPRRESAVSHGRESAVEQNEDPWLVEGGREGPREGQRRLEDECHQRLSLMISGGSLVS